MTVAPAPPASLGDAALVAEARRIGYRLDPHAVIGRAARAHADRRRVTLRPAPDNMAVLSGLLPPLTASLSTPP